jgi:hypothetical protein
LKQFLAHVTLWPVEEMHRLADEIREVFDERGHKIAQATRLDPAFTRSRRPQSALGRDLFLDTAERMASRLALGWRPVGGGGSDVVALIDGVERRFRILKATSDPESGDLVIVCRSDSILTVADTEPDDLVPVEQWVLGYTVDDQGVVVQIFAARVLGLTESAVPRLRLGAVTFLGTCQTPEPGGRFVPPDEDDLGEGLGWSDADDATGESDAG